MGDHGAGRADRPNGLLPGAAAGVGRAIEAERWARAEDRVELLIARIMPSWDSEARRTAVSGYVQRLIMNCFSCRVFTFGSVPLKTYLPDGDIDLTAFSENESLKDTWANDVREALENEEKNENAEFHVKEVQYIQAEVKIIKCLVEDIVVDISFNQVGGLCTLCFLDEVDTLIDQNHLFKKSIILIKAWCYYESRILGAHHGLISTYALETLVLYIFHVYNNSFAGPLEVLYRFLEFFSNFDWENFCLSLLGPIPVSSLPEMTAEPPRNDDGELLLSKLFLDVCNAFYAVFPAGQENQGQPFVSKYFNIVDPLRINNNLGRSVSKGNFFRIRSAFTFGAKRLARLLDCPNENLIAEVNQFFTNTWERHGSGSSHDARSLNLWTLRPSKTAPVDESNNSQSASVFKKKSENNALADHEYQLDGDHASHGLTSEVLRASNQQFPSLPTSGISHAVYHANKNSHGSQIKVSDHTERNTMSRGSAQTHAQQKYLRPDHFVNDKGGHDTLLFARTQSSPELTGISPEAFERGTRNNVPEPGKNQIALNRFEHGGTIKNYGFDPSPSTEYTAHPIIDASDSHSASDSYLDSEKQVALVSETLDMHQEEQDLVNMMASSRAHHINEQVRLPTNLPSLVPIPLSTALVTSIGYNQRNLGGMVQTNIPVIDPSRGIMRYPQSTLSSPLSHQLPTSGLNLRMNDMVDYVYRGSGMTGMNLDDDEKGFWHDDEAGSNRSNLDNNGGFQKKPHSHDKKQPTRLEPSFASPSQASNSGASVIRGQHKLAIEHTGQICKDDTGPFQSQPSRGNNVQSTVRNGHIVPFPVPKAVSSRSKPASECFLDRSDKGLTSARDKRERKLTTAEILIRNALFGNPRNRRQLQGSSNQNRSEAVDETLLHKHEVRGHEPDEMRETSEISGQDSITPLPSITVSSSQQRVLENSRAVPLRFFPTGPPVPFAVLPMYNFPSDTGNAVGSTSQFDSVERVHLRHANSSGQNFGSSEGLCHPEIHSLTNASPESSEEKKSDILFSDFSSHWQNLQYGRFCQNTKLLGPYPAVPGYLQGHFPWDGPGRPQSTNMNLSSQVVSYVPPLVPVAPLQHGIVDSAFQHFGDEGPRYRGGTGTYLPNSKVPSRERSSTRSHRGNYNHDQNDADREGNWNNSKSRTAGRSHGRTRAEKLVSRPDRSISYDNRANRPWPHDLYQAAQDSSFMSTNSSRNSLNMAHGTYSLAAVNSNGINPNRVGVPSSAKLYSYDQGVPYGSHTEGLNYGSLALINLSAVNETSQPSDENPVREEYRQRHGTYHGSSRSSSG